MIHDTLKTIIISLKEKGNSVKEIAGITNLPEKSVYSFLTKKTSRCELECSGIAVTPSNSFGRDKEVTMACPNPDRTSARIECVC